MTAAQPIGLRARKKAQTRRRIMDVTVELIRDRGYEETRVDEIVRRVEISPPTFYSYFDSKDDVLCAVAVEQLNEFVSGGYRESETRHLLVDERIRLLYKGLSDWMVADRELWRSIVLCDGLDPYVHPEQMPVNTRGQQRLESILADGIERNELRSDLPLSVLAGLLDSMVHSVHRAWGADAAVLARPEITLESMLDYAIELFLNGAKPRSTSSETTEDKRPKLEKKRSTSSPRAGRSPRAKKTS